MDPNAAYRQWMAAYLNGNQLEARQYGEALLEWLSKGGFPPADWVQRDDAEEVKEAFFVWAKIHLDPRSAGYIGDKEA